jgi:heterodisulfide reductase subunit A-like polyferredoxin
LEEKDKKTEEKNSKGLSRREFLKDAGLVAGGAAVGSMAILSACSPAETITETKNNTLTSTVTSISTAPGSTVTQPATTVTVEKQVVVEKLVTLPKSSVIAWDATKCVSCGRCMQACSLYHEGATSYTLSAIKWHEEKFFEGWVGELPTYPYFCQQ